MEARGRLPQLSSCGPIEACACAGSLVCGFSLPQLSSCGPIEAARPCMRGPRRLAAFRNYQVAAPLKRRLAVSFLFRLCSLPQLSSCGPIEAGADFDDWARILALPQLSSCGPIEAWAADLSQQAVFPPFRNYQVAAPLKQKARLCI